MDMRTTSFCIPAVAVALFFPAALQGQSAQMIVAVCERTVVGNRTLSVARNVASRVFENAGIRIRWEDAGDCLQLSTHPQFLIVVDSRPPAGWTSAHAMGFAPSQPTECSRAYVFLDRVRAFVAINVPERLRSEADGIILGHVIAHELGHLLLPGPSHEAGGIMRGRWKYAQWRNAALGLLLFRPAQAAALQRQAAIRTVPAVRTAPVAGCG